MKFLWPVLLVVLRALYFLYSLWCLLFPLAAVWFVIALARDPSLLGIGTRQWTLALLVVLLVFAAAVLGLVYHRRSKQDPNPFQSAFLSWFGTLRGFWNQRAGDMVKLGLPSGYIVENPQAYRIAGRNIQDILQCIQPGDILLRGYDGYLDGMMIRRASVASAKEFQPGWFTHAALYMGPLTAVERALVPENFRNESEFFQEGSQMLIHAMAKGVHSQDLLTFCRSDYLAILRIKPGNPQIDVASAIQTARKSALEKIGVSYDFDASDTHSFHRFSCSELVYYCLRDIKDALKIGPLPHALFPLAPLNKRFHMLTRVTIVPDDFYYLQKHGTVECIWQDPISAARHAAGKLA
jgi:hypothetical protein